jgi:hypothetical protein
MLKKCELMRAGKDEVNLELTEEFISKNYEKVEIVR